MMIPQAGIIKTKERGELFRKRVPPGGCITGGSLEWKAASVSPRIFQ
jgi:hypothetical protein